jgi:hypothetical protein
MVMVEKVCQLQQRQRKTKKGKQRENVERRARTFIRPITSTYI